ncbi:MAG TPA: DNA polymerase III subunit delta' [Usitatibacter sp.]
MNPLPWHREALAGVLAMRDRMPHALLVHGRAGIGKVEFARALGAAVLCESPREGLACGHCPSCHWLSQGNHPDYREIVPEAANEDDSEGEDTSKPDKAKSLVIKIDQVRAVADFIALTTHRAGYRVLLIHPAEAMHPGAANALLKTLEEPPPMTLIVLVSDQPARLLATIRSRCRLVGLATPDHDVALRWLNAEGVAGAESALAAAGGAPLLARELAAPEEAELRKRIVNELAKPGGADALQLASVLDKGAVPKFVFWMQTWVQDLLRVRMSGNPRHHVEHAQALRSRARGANLDLLFALDRDLAEARRLSAHPLNARLVAEHLLMSYNQATMDSRP